jgi:DNA polymerase
MIVTLGRFSMAKFFPGKTIGKIHGTAQKRDGMIYFAMYHPAAALHQQSLRATIAEDMLKIPGYLAEMDKVEEKKPETTPPAQQLSMF